MAIDGNEEVVQFFLPEWITQLYFGMHWEPIARGSYREIKLPDGEVVIVYQDLLGVSTMISGPLVVGYKWIASEPEEKRENEDESTDGASCCNVTELHPNGNS
jgi:hypothetical protein